MKQPSFLSLWVVLSACIFTEPLGAAGPAKPLKVFILAGQSNMEGHAKVETFDYLADDPATAPLLKQMRDESGAPRVCDHVWISYLTGWETNGEGFGKLTAGYGARQNPAEPGGKIGPEFTFGLAMDRALDEPVLIIKTAWGGKSLYYDFRPPSAGTYPRTADDIEKNRNPEAQSGHYYRLMIEHVRHVLKDVRRVCPAYDERQGYEIAGFVWLQGFNDMINRDVYPIVPKDSPTPRYADYSRWLSDLIRDVRKDLAAPKMPVVIGVMGIEGKNPNENIAAFRLAMAAPAALPEFQGNVTAVATAPFWDEKLGVIDAKHAQVRQMGYLLKSKNKNEANADGKMTEKQQREYVKQYEAKLISPEEEALWNRGASNAGYHYLGCAKTFALMGQAFAEAALKMMPAASQASASTGTSNSTAASAAPRSSEDVPATVMAPTVMAKRGKLLFADDFERSEVGAAWTTSQKSYAIRDGVFVTGQRPDHGHPAVCRVGVPLKDAVIDFRFKFAGGSQVSLVLNDKDHKGSHAGHICRAGISPTAVTLGDDCEGAMKFGIYELWKDPAKRSQVEQLVESRKQRVPITLDTVKSDDGPWHCLTVEIVGEEMTATLDGKPVAYLKSPGIAHAVKNYWGFTTSGRYVEIDDVKAWAAEPDAGWKKRRAELFTERGK